MPRQITARHIPRHISRREAKRWLKAAARERPDARARFERAYPNGPATPVLRDVQHALAREYGLESWTDTDEGARTSVSRRDSAADWPTLDGGRLRTAGATTSCWRMNARRGGAGAR